MAGPYFFGSEGWKLVPGHFAERHGLIVIIALGESIVAIGIGAAGVLDFTMGLVAVLGMGLAAGLWWVYFDVVALVSAKRLGEAEAGKEQNELARDSYSYIHLLLVAGIVLVAFGLKSTIAHAEEHLHDVEAVALLGGVAVYLLGLVAFRLRHVRTLNRQRLGVAIVLVILVPVATSIAAWATLAIVVALMWLLIGLEHRRYGINREQLRREAGVGHHGTA
jgi:low temperature requirement protein LtrA